MATHEDLSHPIVPGTPYRQTPMGLWYQPGVSAGSIGEIPAGGAAEDQACRYLAQTLQKNWLHRFGKHGSLEVVDFLSNNDSLSKAFQELGYTTTVGMSDHSVDFITSLHSFQKLSFDDALAVLINFKKILKPDGYVFIRLPDHDVAGHERDLKDPKIVEKARCFWNLDAWLAMLALLGDAFEIVDTYTFEPGQRDLVLKPIQARPLIFAGMIAKNEERDLPRCLESLRGVIDGLVLVDTGSKDRTMQLPKELNLVPDERLHVEQYLGASEQDESGDWKLWNFSQARNRFVELIDQGVVGESQWTLWMDADDELMDPEKVSNLRYLSHVTIHGIMIDSGYLRWPHHRLWKTKSGVRYSGRCHEYPRWTGNDYIHRNLTIRHDATPPSQEEIEKKQAENSNPRNLRILDREFKEEPSPRCAFYLGNTYKDCGRWAEALPAYQARLNFGVGYAEEYYFTLLYLGRCQRHAGQTVEARKTLRRAMSERPDWAEYYTEMGWLEYEAKDFRKALAWGLLACDMPYVETPLFREKHSYSDQPFRLASWCYEELREPDMALKYAYRAQSKIGGPDVSWDQRIERLRSLVAPQVNAGAVVAPVIAKKKYVWHRPGAIGDVLMTLNHVKMFKNLHPNSELIYRCHPQTKSILEPLMKACGVDQVVTEPVQSDREYTLIGYPISQGYPEVQMRQHLLDSFAKELELPVWSFDGLELDLVEGSKETQPMKYVTIHPHPGWSMYKKWELARWEKIIEWVRSDLGFEVHQIGGPNDQVLTGVRFFGRESFGEQLHRMGNAVFHMGVDSWSNHATNIMWKTSERKFKTKGVILWGSTQVSAAGYQHNRNISLGLPCQPCFREDPKISAQPRGVCPNPGGQTYENPQHACMSGITVEQVQMAIRDLLKGMIS